MTETMAKTSSHEGNVIVLYSVTWVAVCQNRLGAVKDRRILTLASVSDRLQLQQLRHVQQQLCHS